MKAAKLYQAIQSAGKDGMFVNKKGDNYHSCLKLESQRKIVILKCAMKKDHVLVKEIR